MGERAPEDFGPALKAAGQALGPDVELASPEVLQHGRAAVLRVRVQRPGGRSDLGPTVIVKVHHNHEAHLREVTGLRLLAELDDPSNPIGVGILSWADDPELVVLPDLGVHDRLAEQLLRTDPHTARVAWLAWASGLARIAVTAPNPSQRLRELYAAHGGVPPAQESPTEALETLASAAGVDCRTELRQVASCLSDERFWALTPSDACPDNHVLTPKGIQFLDFEFAQIRSLFLDAAYATAPFPTCWCCFAAPEQLFRAGEQAYRSQAGLAWPELGRDEVWQRGMASAMAAWAGMTALRTSRRDADLDRPGTRWGVVMPTWRDRGSYIAERGVRRIKNHFPHLADLITQTLVRTRELRDGPHQPMLVYPAFRGETEALQ